MICRVFACWVPGLEPHDLMMKMKMMMMMMMMMI